MKVHSILTQVADYCGLEIPAPPWTKFMAMNRDGTLIAYQSLPILFVEIGEWVSDYVRSEPVAIIDMGEMQWIDSLYQFGEMAPYSHYKYYGISLLVPPGYRFIATDASGEVYAFTHEPHLRGDRWCNPDDGHSCALAVIPEPPEKVVNTLTELEPPVGAEIIDMSKYR